MDKGKDQGQSVAPYADFWDITGWAGRVGAGLLPWSEMLLHPSVAFLPSVSPALSPSGLPRTLLHALVVSQIPHANMTWDTSWFN